MADPVPTPEPSSLYMVVAAAIGAVVTAVLGFFIKWRKTTVDINAAIDRRYKTWIDEADRRMKAIEGELAACQKKHEERDLQDAKVLRELERLREDRGTGAIVVADKTGTITDVNVPVTKLFHRTREELVGAPLSSLIALRVRALHTKAFTEFVNNPKAKAPRRGLTSWAVKGDGGEFLAEIDLTDSYQERGGDWVLVAEIRRLYERFDEESGVRAPESIE